MNVKIILGLLQLALTLFERYKRNQIMKEEHDKLVAEAAAAVLLTTKAGQKLREDVREAIDEDADKLWDELINVA